MIVADYCIRVMWGTEQTDNKWGERAKLILKGKKREEVNEGKAKGNS